MSKRMDARTALVKSGARSEHSPSRRNFLVDRRRCFTRARCLRGWLSRGTLKRKSPRNTIHFTADSGNIELIMRTIHSPNQLSVYGAVSSLCMNLSQRVQGQEDSARVSMSTSEENEQLSQQLDPHEVGSLSRSSHRTQGAAGNCWRTLLHAILRLVDRDLSELYSFTVSAERETALVML